MKSYTFGTDYYPEHWPKERWPEDARMMREMGIAIVRMAEFSWQKFEPREGEFHFEDLDEAIEILASEGIDVILGTPSAAPPKATPPHAVAWFLILVEASATLKLAIVEFRMWVTLHAQFVFLKLSQSSLRLSADRSLYFFDVLSMLVMKVSQAEI